MKKAYIIHGWDGSSSSEPWFAWLKKELPKKGFEVVAFDMPDTHKPKIKSWINFLIRNVKGLNEKTYFIGHSVGCQAVLRYLESLPANKKIAGCVLVAPWMHLDKNTIEEEGEEVIEIAKPWMETPIDYKKIKNHTNNFLTIFSDDDPYVPLTNIKLFEKNLSAKSIIIKKQEHFNETKEIKEILEFIK